MQAAVGVAVVGGGPQRKAITKQGLSLTRDSESECDSEMVRALNWYNIPHKATLALADGGGSKWQVSGGQRANEGGGH